MRLALTLGDPAGIGPEVVLKALADPDRPPAAFVVYGPARALDDRARRFGLKSPADLGVEVGVGGGDDAGDAARLGLAVSRELADLVGQIGRASCRERV